MPEPEPQAELDARFSGPDATATPWGEVRAVLERSELFWISTVRADGRPHVTPLPAVWDDGALHFCTGAGEQKGVNLARNAHCALTTGTNTWKSGLDVVVEGRAERITDERRLSRLAELWSTKYHGDWQYEVRDGAFHHEAGEALVFRVSPAKVIAFAKGDFAQTRFRFPPARGQGER
jgi:nitroimidazol reductase NimA-like FMN-containing flavoprotein (pyridoxamine 5'-phosphate oxidase superfamily)